MDIENIRSKIDGIKFKLTHKPFTLYWLPDNTAVADFELGHPLSDDARVVGYGVLARATVFHPWEVDPNSFQENT